MRGFFVLFLSLVSQLEGSWSRKIWVCSTNINKYTRSGLRLVLYVATLLSFWIREKKWKVRTAYGRHHTHRFLNCLQLTSKSLCLWPRFIKKFRPLQTTPHPLLVNSKLLFSSSNWGQWQAWALKLRLATTPGNLCAGNFLLTKLSGLMMVQCTDLPSTPARKYEHRGRLERSME